MELQACILPTRRNYKLYYHQINGITGINYYQPVGITEMYSNSKDGITGMFYHPILGLQASIITHHIEYRHVLLGN